MFMRENSERLYLNINRVSYITGIGNPHTNHILPLKINVTFFSVDICTISMYLFAVMVTEPGNDIIPNNDFD